MCDLRAACVLRLPFGLVACHEKGRDNGSSSSSTGPDAACAGAGSCAEGQVCASITPGSNEIRACSSPDNGPVCPPNH